MKQLYATLEDKESELRDFIRNYEQVSNLICCWVQAKSSHESSFHAFKWTLIIQGLTDRIRKKVVASSRKIFEIMDD